MSESIRIPLPFIVRALEVTFSSELRRYPLWSFVAMSAGAELDREINRGPISAIAYARNHGSATAAVLAIDKAGGWQ